MRPADIAENAAVRTRNQSDEAFSKLEQQAKRLSELSRRTSNPVAWMYERLKSYIREFEEGLAPEEELGASLVSFGNTTTFHIESIGYHGPDMVCFHGIGADGRRLMLVQHMSQLSVLLIALPKIGVVARRIGFRVDEVQDSNEVHS